METTWHVSIKDERTQQLMNTDSVLAGLITDIGDINKNIRPDPLKSIIRSIVGQQISVKAAATIFERLTQKINNDWSVERISKLTQEDMAEIGLSTTKQKYLFNLIEYIKDKALDFTIFTTLSNSEIIKRLTAVKVLVNGRPKYFLFLQCKEKTWCQLMMLDYNVQQSIYTKHLMKMVESC